MLYIKVLYEILQRTVKLENLKTEKDINTLSIKQCKEILKYHQIDITGVIEKQELFDKLRKLVNVNSPTEKGKLKLLIFFILYLSIQH